jgi:hypothetical protein
LLRISQTILKASVLLSLLAMSYSTLETSINYFTLIKLLKITRSSTILEISHVSVTCFYTFADCYLSSGNESKAFYISSKFSIFT